MGGDEAENTETAATGVQVCDEISLARRRAPSAYRAKRMLRLPLLVKH
jgi:hypothetical protein